MNIGIVVIVKSEINIVWNFCFGIIILFFVKIEKMFLFYKLLLFV